MAIFEFDIWRLCEWGDGKIPVWKKGSPCNITNGTLSMCGPYTVHGVDHRTIQLECDDEKPITMAKGRSAMFIAPIPNIRESPFVSLVVKPDSVPRRVDG